MARIAQDNLSTIESHPLFVLNWDCVASVVVLAWLFSLGGLGVVVGFQKITCCAKPFTCSTTTPSCRSDVLGYDV